MPRFQAVHRYYQQCYDDVAAELGRCNGSIAQVEERLREQRAAREQSGHGVGVVWHDQYAAYCAWSLNQEAALGMQLAQLRKQRDDCQQRLLEARQRLKSIEMLQERERKELARRERRKEEIRLGEFISQSIGRVTT